MGIYVTRSYALFFKEKKRRVEGRLVKVTQKMINNG